VLLLAALVAGYFTYTRYIALSLPVPLIPTLSTLITVEESAEVAGQGQALLEAIQQAAVSPLAPGSVRVFSAENMASTSVFSLLQLGAPGVLLRNIVPERSLAGVVHAGGAQHAFFILGVSSFGDTFAGMLQWEPRIEDDLGKLFPPYPASAPATTSPATLPQTSIPESTNAFIDRTIMNHDVRVLLDEEGRSLLVYGYWNQYTLVIARDEAAFTELLRRIAASRAYR
jgi:hypothetical protein